VLKSASIQELTAICVFARTSLLKGFFVPKKQKHEMRLTNGLAKNRRTEVNSALFRYFASVPTYGTKFSR